MIFVAVGKLDRGLICLLASNSIYEGLLRVDSRPSQYRCALAKLDAITGHCHYKYLVRSCAVECAAVTQAGNLVTKTGG
jgi:hypothetical protein